MNDQDTGSTAAPAIDGFVASGWDPVRDAFEANFSQRGDLGAGVAVYHRGERVVDLVGGHRDRDRTETYGADTLQLIFSSTKGVTAACVAVCVDRGWLDPMTDVRTMWPAFPGDITVEQLMSHQAGLITIEPPLTLAQCLEPDTAMRALEGTTPVWEPGSRHGYHAITFGWLAGELVRLADPQHRSLGRFLREEIVEPLHLDMWIGLPDDQQPRVARLVGAPPPEDPAELAVLAARSAPGTLAERALTVSGAFPMTGRGLPWNKPEVRAAELGGANAVTNAHSLAKLYGAMVAETDGVRLTTDATVDSVRRPRVAGLDACLGVDTSFGLGFMLDTAFNPLLGHGSFGHPGAGGSLGFADPETGIGFGYVMNQMRTGLAADSRPAALIEAIRRCVPAAARSGA
jgi:CubicO group peptidase (beta-lactamase class C family)